MSKKPDSQLKVYVVERHVNPAGSVYVESSIVGVLSNKRRAKELVDSLNAELEIEDEDVEYTQDYVSYSLTKHFVEGVAA